ncbi:MAG: TraB/GumN family protein [Thermoplasmata archaeon]|nr:TraB/GumN family protein [Thermoplasmata archaeon]
MGRNPHLADRGPLDVFSSTLEAPVLLVGAAHVVDLDAAIRRTLKDRPLDAIAVELDEERARSLLAETPVSGRGGDAPLFLRLWSVVQRRLGGDLGAGFAGAEMRSAATVARERGIPLLLIDDPIRQTVGRLIASLSPKERIGLLVGSIVGLFLPSRLVRHEIDKYVDSPQDYVDQLRQAYPSVARVLLDERNEHMAGRLVDARRNGYGRVAAVVGDAHVAGLAAALRGRGVPCETVAFGALREPTGS